MISYSSSGNTDKTDKFLAKLKAQQLYSSLDKHGRIGVEALRIATPTDKGLTASSWTYKIVKTKSSYSIVWINTNVVSGIPVAILLQYGHATGTGGWVEGKDYINPTIQPIFDKIAHDVWKEVTNG